MRSSRVIVVGSPRAAVALALRLGAARALRLATLLPILLCIAGCHGGSPAVVHHPESGYAFPDPKDIRSIEIRWDLRSEWRNRTFYAPKDHWAIILSCLTPSERDPRPMKWEAIGSILIRTTEGNQCWVGLFDTFEDLGAFAAGPTIEDREYYRGGNSAKLKAAIQAAHSASERLRESVGTESNKGSRNWNGASIDVHRSLMD
jgi:hypothetical protein